MAVAADLAAKLATRSRHVCLLLGAGTSCAAGLPDVNVLLSRVLESLDGAGRQLAEDLYRDRNLEEGLTRLRRIRALLSPGEEFAGFTPETALDLEMKITASIIDNLQAPAPDLAAVTAFASWAAGEFYLKPIEVFTVNYDLLIETGLELVGASYFDGFVGSLRAHFRPDLVEPRDTAVDQLPNSFVRLWKLHGSLNWLAAENGTVVRTGSAVAQQDMAAIYPSDEKYDQSRRVPFVVLHDRLRRALAEPETFTLVSGYSFGDAHLNEVLFDAARRYPRSEIAVFCYSSIPDELVTNIQPNITVVAASEAIISGERRDWGKPEASMTPEVWNGSSCQLGDFTSLSRFLAKARRIPGNGLESVPVEGTIGDAN
ncbi:SIR2 family protein [Georgenia thermotolerans]|uniref:SIR2 family protein n=1 Tax=Georgenia thermotolerans TaxID=527326 RepID=UPI001B8AF64C|nr:SIR2 family protein [Georgenia thermotolerans]